MKFLQHASTFLEAYWQRLWSSGGPGTQ